jgi:hypothetical protein
MLILQFTKVYFFIYGVDGAGGPFCRNHVNINVIMIGSKQSKIDERSFTPLATSRCIAAGFSSANKREFQSMIAPATSLLHR